MAVGQIGWEESSASGPKTLKHDAWRADLLEKSQ
jgi:hypothetical protein